MYVRQLGADIVERATAQLRQSQISALHNVQVEVDGNGAVTLTGRVGSYYYKQIAQETVTPVVPSDTEIINNITVNNPKK